MEPSDQWGVVVATPVELKNISETRKHAFCSASSSKRWSTCTASPGFVARERAKGNIPERTESVYSKEGTLAHDLAAACIEWGYSADMFEDKDMARHVKGYVELAESWKAIEGSTFFLETDVPLFYHPAEFGFLDIAVIDPIGKRVLVGDLKYGAGVSVEAKDNTQLATYAMSLIMHLRDVYGITGDWLVVMLIYQPRIPDEPAKRLWPIKVSDLTKFCIGFGQVAEAIYANRNGGMFRPSDEACGFCDAAGVCTARAKWIFGGLPNGCEPAIMEPPQFQSRSLPLADSLTTEQLGKIVAAAPSIMEWLKQCRSMAAGRLLQGLAFPGYKLIEGKSNRKWRNEEEAAELIGLTELPVEEQFSIKVVSPAQAQEKLSKEDWARVKHLVTKPPGRPTMVHESHAKPALVINTADIFDNLDQDTGF